MALKISYELDFGAIEILLGVADIKGIRCISGGEEPTVPLVYRRYMYIMYRLIQLYVPLIGDFALNNEYEIIEYRNINQVKTDIFVKPLNEIKKFNGVILRQNETLREKHAQIHGKWFEPAPDCKLIICPYKEIWNEYRVVVVDGKPITGSTYDCSSMAPDHVLDSVRKVSEIWNPIDCYVVDMATTPEGNKVVEYNQFSTSAMYACDQNKIVDALEKLLNK